MALTDAQIALVNRVLRRLDAFDSPGSNIITNQDEIYDLLEEAARLIIHEVPLRLLHDLVADATATANEDSYLWNLQSAGKSRILLPSDFMRLVHLELDGWTMGRTQEDLHEDSIVTYRKFLRGEVATTGEPYIFRTWAPRRYRTVMTWTGVPLTTELWGVGYAGFAWETGADLVTGLTVETAASVDLALQIIEDIVNRAYVFEGTHYSPVFTADAEASIPSNAEHLIRVDIDTDADTATFYTGDATDATAETLTNASFDAATVTALTQREAIDCFPASGDSTEEALLSALNYIPDTAPENMPTILKEAMLWRAAALLAPAIDPQLSEHCLVRYQQSLDPRITRHRTAFTVERRGMGL